MKTGTASMNPSLRLVKLYVGVLLCAVVAAWATSVSFGFRLAPPTPSVALIRNVAAQAPSSGRALPHTTLGPSRVTKTVAPTPSVSSSAPRTTIARSRVTGAAATKFVPVTQNVDVITQDQSNASSTDSAAGDSSTTTTTLADG